MPRNFGLTSRPGAGAVDRPAGSIAPRGWRNLEIQLPAAGITSVGLREGRSLSESEPAVHGPGVHSNRSRFTSPALIQFLSSDGGVESRHAARRSARGGAVIATVAAGSEAGVAPGPSDSIQSTVANASSPSRHYGAPMRRILSQPVLGQRPQPANDHRNSEPDEERHDRQPRPCDAWQLPHVRSPLESLACRSPLERGQFSQAAIDIAALVSFGLLGFLVALAGLLILVGIFGMPVFDLG